MRTTTPAVVAGLLLTACAGPARETAPSSEPTRASGGRTESAPAARQESVEPNATGTAQDTATTTEAEPQVQVDRYGARLDQRWTDLQDTLALASVDCSRARELRDRICALSERICDIASDHPRDDEVQRRCSDARERCERARNNVEEACGEG